MKSRFPTARVFLCAFATLLVSGPMAAATAATLIVQDDLPCPNAQFFSINSAIAAANNGDTIVVCAGIYPENVIVNKSVVLKGAQAGVAGVERPTNDLVTESTVAGSFSVVSPGVVIDGFTVLLGSPFGASPLNTVAITVKVTGSGATIKNNVVDQVASANGGAVITGNAIGVYLERGPDNVKIGRNRIQNLSSDASAQGVLVGDSVSTNPSFNILISDNLFENIQSALRGAYGVAVNNGANATGFATVVVRKNVIQHLKGGGWAHAIGLEGPTPDAQVMTNEINDVVGPALPDSSQNAISVFFEDNPHFASAETHLNNFNVTRLVAYGIAVDPALSATSGGKVPGTCNWWNASDGPGPIGPGSGARVTKNVKFDPWLTAPVDIMARAPRAPCNDNDECVADDDDDFDHDGKRDDVDADDDNDGKADLNDDDDDNDGKWDNDDDDDDNDCVKDRDDDKSTRQHQRNGKGTLGPGAYSESVVAASDLGLPIMVRVDSPNAQFLVIEIVNPLGQTITVSVATPGSIFATTPAQVLGLYKVRIRSNGVAPIDYTSKLLTSSLW